MRLPSLRRIFSTDFKPEFKQMMDQLGILFNGGIEPVYNALNNNLTFEDNFAATVTELVLSTNADGVPNQSVSFKLSSNQKTFGGSMVLDARGAKDSSILPQAAVFIVGTQNGNYVNISNVKGLSPGVSYRIKLVAFS